MTDQAINSELDRLPHRPPFRFLTRIDLLEPEQARATWLVTGAEDFLRGHFPGDPIVPGVLIGEALAQLSGLIGAKWPAMSGRLAHIDLRFLATARPPAEFQLSSRLLRVLGNVGLYDVTAAVGATTVARGSLSIARMVEP